MAGRSPMRSQRMPRLIYGVSRCPPARHVRSPISPTNWLPTTGLPMGNKLAFTRSTQSRDIVLISNFH